MKSDLDRLMAEKIEDLRKRTAQAWVEYMAEGPAPEPDVNMYFYKR